MNAKGHASIVMLSEARNLGYFCWRFVHGLSDILRFAQNDSDRESLGQNVRSFIICITRPRLRANRLSSCDFYRTVAHLRSASASRPAGWVLENVYDRDPARSYSRFTGLFLESHCEICEHVSKGRTR